MSTPYSDVNAVLDLLLTEVRAVLGDHFVGMYLYGSLSSGDFDLRTSDVDFLVVTDDLLPDSLIEQLEAMHTRIGESGLKFAKKLEGSYIPKAGLRRFNPAAPPIPHLNEGRFYVAQHGSDWIIQRQVIREGGVVVFGEPAKDLIDPVLPDDVRRAVLGIMREWWTPMLDEPSFFERSDYQAFGIITMCRVLYTLEHGAVASKPVSARWAKERLGEPYAGMIDRALAWQPDVETHMFDDALKFLSLTVERCRQYELAHPDFSAG